MDILIVIMMRLFSSIFVLCFLIAAYIVWVGFRDTTKEADVIVVLGNTVNPDGTLSPRLKARMDKGIELFREGKGKYLIVSGGLGVEGVEESSAMKKYALSRGLPATFVVADASGINTDATAKYVAEFLKDKKLKSAIAVSQFFHLARSSLSFSAHGVQEVGHARADYYEWEDIYSLGREVIALPVYWIKSLLPR